MLNHYEGTNFQFEEKLPIVHSSLLGREGTFFRLSTSCPSFLCKYLDLIFADFWKKKS